MKNGSSDLSDICVAGITPFTTIDFPGKLAAVFYLQGCPWRCRYCCNSEFWSLPDASLPSDHASVPAPTSGVGVSPEKMKQFLLARKGHLDGIVFSGGEPTIHKRLPVWMSAVRALGYQVGLHTAGANPELLRAILPFCDWVGMDVKAPFHLYEKITMIPGSGTAARMSVQMLMASQVPYELRTTIHPELLSDDDVLAMIRELVSLGATRHVLQLFRPDHCADKKLVLNYPLTAGVSDSLLIALRGLLKDFSVRGKNE